MISLTSALALGSLVSLVSAHGFVTDPPARMPGKAMQKACGEQVAINQESDNYGNIQGELQIAAGQSDYKDAACDIWLCKGYKFADNRANVQSYTAGQKVPMTVDIRAPHTGAANVSIVDTATNTVIGPPLKSWQVYGSNASPIPAAQEHFAITMPDDLGGRCATAGACVIQWYWFAESIDQTYESCIDFELAGSGDAAPSASSASGKPPGQTARPTTPSTLATSPTSSRTMPSFYPPANTTVAAPTGPSNPVSTVIASTGTTVDVTVTVTGTGSNGAPTDAPTGIYTVVPTTVPTGGVGSGVGSGSGSGSSASEMPKGTTVEKLLSWIWYRMRMLRQKQPQRRHARDMAV